MKFCENPVCPHHVDVPDYKGCPPNRLEYVTASGNRATTARFKIILAESKKELYFCSTCVNVVSLINAP